MKNFKTVTGRLISYGMLLITASTALTGCIKPNYRAQYVDVPDYWRLPADEGSTLCNARWWEQFDDPVLDDLIWTSLRNNQDLKVAISRVLEYYARLGVTDSALYPAIDGNASYNRFQISKVSPLTVPGVSTIFSLYQATLNLSWELDFWGRIRSASEASYAELLAQVENRRAVVVTVVSSVAKAYIALRGLDGQLEVAKKTLKSRQDSLELAKDRYHLGETSELEVAQAEAELEIAAISLLQFERAIPQQENLISVLIGENPHDIVRGRTIDTFNYPPVIPAGLPSDLLIRRPDIVAAEDELIAVNAHVAEARALFFPQMNLTGAYGSESSILRAFLTSPAEIWQYGLSAAQTIFDAGRTWFQVEEVIALRDEALYNYRQKILTAFREVNDALVQIKMNKELVLEHEKQVKVLKLYYSLALLRYQEGEVDYLNVLDAERSLFNSELNLEQARADNYTAVVELYSALGGGWVNDADAYAISNDCHYECNDCNE